MESAARSTKTFQGTTAAACSLIRDFADDHAMSVRTCSEKGSHYSITRIHLFPRGIGPPTCGHAPCRDDAMDGVIGDNGGTFRSQICSWGSWTLTGTVAPCCERFRAWSCFFRITLSSAGKALQIIQTSPAARVPILFEPIASAKCRQILAAPMRRDQSKSIFGTKLWTPPRSGPRLPRSIRSNSKK